MGFFDFLKGDSKTKATAPIEVMKQMTPDVATMTSNNDISGLVKALKQAQVREREALTKKDVHAAGKQVEIREELATALRNLKRNGVDDAELNQILPEIDEMFHWFAQLHFDVARECSRQGNVTREIELYTQSIQASPTAAAYFNRGNAYRSKGNQAMAIADYTKAIELDPKDFSAYHNRGMTYVLKQDALHALPDFEKVLELAPTSNEGQKAKENIPKLRDALDATE